MGTNNKTGNKTHTLEQRGNDLYETPEVAVRALMKVEQLPTTIWEPACGPGAIVRVLREAGHFVYATDLIKYESLDQDIGGLDFLQTTNAPFFTEAIVTNPPFRIAGEFVEKGLELTPKVILLLRLAFLESKKRTGILENGHLKKVHVFRERLPMMHRAGWDGPKASSGMAFAWFVWDKNYSGETILNRISW